MFFQGPISNSVSPSFNVSFKNVRSYAMTPRRRPTTVSPNWVRNLSLTTVLPMRSEFGGTMTSAMPISCDRSVK
jgi:hypothetical protein